MPDYRLQYKGDPGTNWDPVTWNAQDGTDWDGTYRYSIAGPPTMGFNGQRNTATYQFRFNLYNEEKTNPTLALENLRQAIAYILGFSNVAANVGNPCARYLQRKMPLKDPDGLGMIAESISPLVFSNDSGYYPQGVDLQIPTFQPEFFEKIPEGRRFDDALVPDNRGKFLYRYAFANVTFIQPLYPVLNDQFVLNDNTFTAGGGDERSRYMFTLEEPSFEYVNLPQAILQWGPPPPAGVTPALIANQKVMNAGGLIRPIMTVKVFWYRLPAQAIRLLIPHWQPLLATVNQSALRLPIYGGGVSYPAQTMAFLPWRTKPRLSPHGFLEYDVELNWSFRGGIGANGTSPNWNNYLYVDGSYYPVGWSTGANTIRKVYPLGDHDSIFSINDVAQCPPAPPPSGGG